MKLKSLIKTIIIVLFLFGFQYVNSVPNKTIKQSSSNHTWWKEAVVYQIYPRSFKDSNGDGIGDLKGIISKLDYIKSLGIDVVWLNPIFTSPNADNGYDISNYEDIMKEFGTMADFDQLLKGLHQRGIKLVLDLVANHSSNQHPWFVKGRSSRTNPFYNYYHWWPAEKGVPPFRPGSFDVNGSAWTFNKPTNSYYLHYFSEMQPDLNWENPKVRQAVFNIMKFWLNKGVDGFRMDVIPFISKDTLFPVITPEILKQKYNGDWAQYYASGPYLHDYLRQMNREVLSHYPNIMTVAEGAGVTIATAPKFVDADRHELNMLYHFDGVQYGYLPGKFRTPDPKGYDLVGFKEIYSKWDSVFATKGWGTIYLGNHDQPRMVSRWGNDSPEWRALSSKMLTTFILTMRATPYYFAGDELGMTNIKFNNIKDYRDIETINMYKYIQNHGGDLNAFLEAQKISARDNSRTPFQWDTTLNAGFTTGMPWIKVNPNYKTVNVAIEEQDSNSCLNYFKKMIRLRKQNKTLIYGKYTLLDKQNKQVYAYSRTLNGNTLLVLLNFSPQEAETSIPLSFHHALTLIDNYNTTFVMKSNTSIHLLPYEAVVLELK
jgi:oligo-1,6-glucosidase